MSTFTLRARPPSAYSTGAYRTNKRWRKRHEPAGSGSDTSTRDYDRLAVTELNADHARPGSEYRIVLPDGQPLPSGTQVIGRGPRLHFLTDTDWYQLDIGDIPG
jgi:hypothetical protein